MAVGSSLVHAVERAITEIPMVNNSGAIGLRRLKNRSDWSLNSIEVIGVGFVERLSLSEYNTLYRLNTKQMDDSV